jgi:hypothetical protein
MKLRKPIGSAAGGFDALQSRNGYITVINDHRMPRTHLAQVGAEVVFEVGDGGLVHMAIIARSVFWRNSGRIYPPATRAAASRDEADEQFGAAKIMTMRDRPTISIESKSERRIVVRQKGRWCRGHTIPSQ